MSRNYEQCEFSRGIFFFSNYNGVQVPSLNFKL